MKKLFIATLMATSCMSYAANAQEHAHHNYSAQNTGIHLSNQGLNHNHALKSNAPVSIMGDHMHSEGDWMISYRLMGMHMNGNRSKNNSLNDNEIAGVVANRFFGAAMQPSTLRIIPQEMDMDMHMLGAMYAPKDWLTLMLMSNYIEKEMTLTTYSMADASVSLGNFTTKTSGWGDTKITSLVRLFENKKHHIHLHAGVSLPTGSLDNEGTILAPNNTNMRMRLPYSMQLGTGTYDLLPGITYTGAAGQYRWGTQYQGEIRLDDNHEDYTFGDKHTLNTWASYSWSEKLSTSIRLGLEYESKIDGIDSQIIGPVQTADPSNYGGKRADIGLGLKFTPNFGAHAAHDFNFEIALPVYQNLNGPQMERDYTLTAGYSIAF